MGNHIQIKKIFMRQTQPADKELTLAQITVIIKIDQGGLQPM